MLIFLFSSLLAGLFISQLYVFRNLSSPSPLDYNTFLVNNLGLMIIVTGILVVVFGYITLLARGLHPLRYLRFKLMSLSDIAVNLAIGIGFALFITSLLSLTKINLVLDDPISEQISQAIASNLPLLVLAVGFFVPFYEEFLFRGMVFQEVQKSVKPWFALLLQGLLFGAVHLNWLQFSYAFPAGIMLGLMYLRYQSLWAPVLIHLAWNSTSALLSFLLPWNISTTTLWGMLLLGAGLLIFGLCFTYKTRPAPHGTDSLVIDCLEADDINQE